ncbi:MAG: hypothetical protein R2856_09805 [Caldilineaceae bacterium]
MGDAITSRSWLLLSVERIQICIDRDLLFLQIGLRFLLHSAQRNGSTTPTNGLLD